MTRPVLTTKFRGAGVTECETFLFADGSLVPLFTYGTGNQVTDYRERPSLLSTHFNGKIWSISPEGGIFSWDPQSPTDSGVLRLQFTDPSITNAGRPHLGWQTIQKNGQTQLMTSYRTTAGIRNHRLVFVDGDENVTETAVITFAGNGNGRELQRGIMYKNKIYCPTEPTTSNVIHIIDPEAENISQQTFSADCDVKDIAVHNGKIYCFSINNTTTVGEGNVLWNLEAPVADKILEWEAYQPSSTYYPSSHGQACCLFSDGDDLVVISYASGTTINKIACWKINFNEDNVPTSITDITSQTLAFTTVTDYRDMRIYSGRVYNPASDTFETHLYFAQGDTSDLGYNYYAYKWNGVSSPITFIGNAMSEWQFDNPGSKLGGGQVSFTAAGELDMRVTSIQGSGTKALIGYYISGTSEVSGVAMLPRFNNNKTNPMTTATVTPVDKGYTSGNYIAGLTAGESGTLLWNIAADGVQPGDLPYFSALLIRTE